MGGLVVVKQHEYIAEVALNRPEAYNAFNLEMITELAQHLTRLATDESVKGVVIYGNGKAFCAGGDLKWAVQFSERPGSS
ncbi:MAG: enoyl-CoA hydratase/isomerase family protein, partial [Syntrophobacterales bacterium]